MRLDSQAPPQLGRQGYLARAGSLDWLEYLPIWLITAGLAWLWLRWTVRKRAERVEAVLLGLAYVFVLGQFAPAVAPGTDQADPYLDRNLLIDRGEIVSWRIAWSRE